MNPARKAAVGNLVLPLVGVLAVLGVAVSAEAWPIVAVLVVEQAVLWAFLYGVLAGQAFEGEEDE